MRKVGSMKRACVSIALVVLATTGGYFALGQSGGDRGLEESSRTQDLQLFEGLPGVCVVVEKVEEPLDQQRLRTAVELRLRQVGVPVLETQQVWPGKGRPSLYIRVGTTSDSALSETALSDYAFSIEVSLNEFVTLERKPSTTRRLARTWYSGHVSLVGSNKLIDSVTEGVLKDVDSFANLYLAANPSKSSTTRRSK